MRAVTAEPRMEDLLASIRKAIHEDIGEVPRVGPAAAAAPIKGTMRELRVKVGDEVTSAAAEIEEIKARIQRDREQEQLSPPRRAPLPRSGAGFADIMSGDSARNRRRFDTEVHYEPPPRGAPRYLPPPEARPVHDDSLLSPGASSSVGHAFNHLADAVLSRAVGDRSLEDMTRELLRGMLKQWLDDNLPGLVERLVREEIERVARRGR